MKLLPIILILFVNAAAAQDTIQYNISFPNAVHHEAEISILLNDVQQDKVTAVMSKSSPGRYAIHNFGKNIYNLQAIGSEGELTNMKRKSPDSWEISGFGESLTIGYTLFANHASGTYAGIDANFANLNMPASLMWIKELADKPVKVTFKIPATSNWKIATQLQVLDSAKHIYAAQNLQYLMDSPCMLSDFKTRKLDQDLNDGYNIYLAINSNASDDELDEFAKMTQRILDEQKAIYGEYPEFEDSSYVFLCSYGPGFHGDAMEHRNSSMIANRDPLSGNLSIRTQSLSHEFFHCWNIERIRPASLEPFNFADANVTGELWFGEGFTSYYEVLILCRAGIMNENIYMNQLSQKINYFLNAPGRKFGSPVYMSEMATFADEAAHNDETNFSNTFLSYYIYGEMVALVLDLSLRTEFEDLSLDQLMRAMWIKYGTSETPYSNADIQKVLAELTGDEDFAESFFEDFVYGNVEPDFESLFDQLGYKLIMKNPNKTSLGFVRLKFDGDTATVLNAPQIGTGLYDAGVNRGDLILSLDDQPVTSYPELNFIVGTRKVGDEIEIRYSHFGELKEADFKLQADSQYVLIPKERFSMRINEDEEAARRNWLKSQTAD